jgi:fluoroacetyl-CoA thioesterase
VHIERAKRAELTYTVTSADTAAAQSSSGVEVLSTGRLISLCEQVACSALSDLHRDGHTTVTVGIQFEHVQPVAVGAVISVEATLERSDGRKLVFTVHAHDRCGLVAAGKLTRVLVDEQHFVERAR